MKTIPSEMYEAALVDGASLWTRYWQLTLPLCRPALAALATLLTTWIYNDFFWAITLISTGNKRPITSALADLQGQFVANQNMIAAAALHRRDTDPDRLHRAAEAVHRRSVARLVQGITDTREIATDRRQSRRRRPPYARTFSRSVILQR